MLDMVSDILHHFPAIELLLQQLLEDPERDVRQKDFFESRVREVSNTVPHV
jgi:hypothetical protein